MFSKKLPTRVYEFLTFNGNPLWVLAIIYIARDVRTQTGLSLANGIHASSFWLWIKNPASSYVLNYKKNHFKVWKAVLHVNGINTTRNKSKPLDKIGSVIKHLYNSFLFLEVTAFFCLEDLEPWKMATRLRIIKITRNKSKGPHPHLQNTKNNISVSKIDS